MARVPYNKLLTMYQPKLLEPYWGILALGHILYRPHEQHTTENHCIQSNSLNLWSTFHHSFTMSFWVTLVQEKPIILGHTTYMYYKKYLRFTFQKMYRSVIMDSVNYWHNPLPEIAAIWLAYVHRATPRAFGIYNFWLVKFPSPRSNFLFFSNAPMYHD